MLNCHDARVVQGIESSRLSDLYCRTIAIRGDKEMHDAVALLPHLYGRWWIIFRTCLELGIAGQPWRLINSVQGPNDRQLDR